VRVYEGIAKGIESLSYDWITGNLYWTDSDLNWIAVSENTFTYYTPVFWVKNGNPYALAIHAKRR